jgi:replicative DNA helicase
VLGSIFLSPEIFDAITEKIGAEDFYRESHREIFRAMLMVAERRQPIDAITLCAELKTKGILEEIGGPGYIAELADAMPTALHAEHYAQIVKDKAILRGIVTACTEIASGAYQAGEPSELLNVLEYEAAKLQARNFTAPPTSKKATLAEVL